MASRRLRSPGHTALRILGAALVLLELAGTAQAASAEPQKQVLVLYSTRRDARIAVLGERELPRILDQGLQTRLDYYTEYIDRARFPEPEYRAALRDFLNLKYRDVRFDVVVAMSDVALEFLAHTRGDLFRGSPVVFFSNTHKTPLFPNSTGLESSVNFTGTLLLASRLQPGLKHVFVVSGAGDDDKAFERAARSQLVSYESRFDIQYLSGLTTPDLDRRLSALPADSMVYYTVVDRDGAGHLYHPLDYLDHVTSVASAPVYSWVDSGMDHGIVGGSLKQQSAQVDAVGEVALRILHGESADSIPISTRNLNADQVDWRQLRRWRISESLVPSGTVIRFREPSAWDRYKNYFLALTVVMLAQTALIAGLLIQRSRRRRAEHQLRGSETQLRSSYDRIRDLGARLLNAQETERSRIARELHDDISQQIALLAIDLELLQQPGSRPAQGLAGAALARVEGIARSVHDMSHRLHPAKLRLIGLVTALQSLQRELTRADFVITFTHEDVPAVFSADLTLCVFRVVQEALQNAIKYSRAGHVRVNLSGGPGCLALTIADDGVGFEVDSAWGTGLGLISMRERLEAIGGVFDIVSTPGAGTRIDIVVPLESAEKKNAAV
jgi:signal transduction histidine kinase